MKYTIYITMFLAILFAGCEEDTIPENALTDYPVNIAGKWGIEKVLLNDFDITSMYEFSSFELTLNYSEDTPTTFAIANEQVPFPTLNAPGQYFSEGAWEFDNPVYPSEFQLKGASNVAVSINQPLYSSENTQLIIKFHMGCPDNNYVYQLTKK